MSYELFVLVAMVVLLPLIQLVGRTARQKARRLPEDNNGRRALANQVPRRQPAIDALAVVPPLAATAGDSAQHAATARERTALRDATRPRSVPGGRKGVHHQTVAMANLSDGTGLRRAIALAAILGPCRAHDPDAQSGSGLS